MKNRARTGSLRKKQHRFSALRKRRKEQAHLFEAIERRERSQSAHLAAVRSALRSNAVSSLTLKRRREEYLEIPKPAPSSPFPRAALGAIALAFLLPVFLALSSSFTISAQRHNVVARASSRSRPSVVARASSRSRPSVVARVYSRSKPNVARANVFARPNATSFAQHNVVARVYSSPQPNVVARVYSSPQPNVVARVYSSPQPNVVARVYSRPGAQSNLASRINSPQLHYASAASKNSRQLHYSERFIASILQLVFGTAPQPRATTKPTARVQESSPVALSQSAPSTHNRVATEERSQPLSPWTLSPDGTWVALMRAPASMRAPSFSTSTGQLIELEQSAVSADAATVTIGWPRQVVVTISSDGEVLTKTLPAPDASAEAFDAVAVAVGPHLVDVGWTPLSTSTNVADYEVFRSSGEGERPALISTLPADRHFLRDADVGPSSRYRYSVVAQTTDDSIQASTPLVQTPAALPMASAKALSGKGMFLYFSSLSTDRRNFHRYDPDEVIAEAQRAGIHVIELRMARGACTMAQTHEAHAWLDRLMDAATAANIQLLAWTVPRRTTTQDLAETIAAAEYTTPAGSGFTGLALDLETGDHYMGDGSAARERMIQYIHDVRAAVGPHYLIVATVISPSMGNVSQSYPYAQIARYADVLQPMEYWHYFDEAVHHAYARGEVAQAAADAVAQTRRLAGRDIPVDVAGQTVDLEGTGAPSGQEILWSLDASKSVGAIGETFFDWAGTQPDAWAAIQAFDW
jgi:hypothetical protein